MPSRKKATIGDWFAYQVYNTSLPWLLGFFVMGVGFYFVTTNTLEIHSKELVAIREELKASKNATAGSQERIREQFLVDSKATAQGIAELNKQTAVMATTLTMVQKELEKIGQRLDAPPIMAPAPSGRR